MTQLKPPILLSLSAGARDVLLGFQMPKQQCKLSFGFCIAGRVLLVVVVVRTHG